MQPCYLLPAFRLPEYMSEYFNLDWNVPLDGDAEIGDSYGSLQKYAIAA